MLLIIIVLVYKVCISVLIFLGTLLGFFYRVILFLIISVGQSQNNVSADGISKYCFIQYSVTTTDINLLLVGNN